MSLIILQQPASSGSGSATVQGGSESITNGSDTVSVTFGTAFATTPTVVIAISRASGGFLLEGNIVSSSISTTGFTVELSAPAPTAGYTLTWVASTT